MGVCEGSPKSVLPDHLGHADYHGASINQSARYMDAGAHGGQVRECWTSFTWHWMLKCQTGVSCSLQACCMDLHGLFKLYFCGG